MSEWKRSFFRLSDKYPHNHRKAVHQVAVQARRGKTELFEFQLEWHDLGSNRALALKVCIFDDAFAAFSVFADLFGCLERIGETASQGQIVEVLKALDITDTTDVPA